MTLNITPQNANDGQKHPLIVWFHGGGESGYRGLHYNNLSQLKANRGAVAFVSDEAQEIFDGAYVLAPQTPHEWSENLDDARALIDYTDICVWLFSWRIYGIRYGSS